VTIWKKTLVDEVFRFETTDELHMMSGPLYNDQFIVDSREKGLWLNVIHFAILLILMMKYYLAANEYLELGVTQWVSFARPLSSGFVQVCFSQGKTAVVKICFSTRLIFTLHFKHTLNSRFREYFNCYTLTGV